MSEPKIVVITPVRHIRGVRETLESIGTVDYMDDPTLDELLNVIGQYDALYTNPNKSKVFIGRELIDAATNLKVICTASTGTNHIDKPYAAEKGLPILSLTEERHVINKISSTAEHAFALTMTALRSVHRSHYDALGGQWDYEQYIGRQMDHLTVGVIGYGRLGGLYSGYCQAFGCRVLVHDPYKTVEKEGLEQVDTLDELITQSDIIAIHVHVTEETLGMINADCFAQMKEDVLLVNSARGDIVNENDLVAFLTKNPQARIATDVLADEVRNRLESPLFLYAKNSEQVVLTQHIGGMTREAQEMAYGHAAKRLQGFFES